MKNISEPDMKTDWNSIREEIEKINQWMNTTKRQGRDGVWIFRTLICVGLITYECHKDNYTYKDNFDENSFENSLVWNRSNALKNLPLLGSLSLYFENGIPKGDLKMAVLADHEEREVIVVPIIPNIGQVMIDMYEEYYKPIVLPR